MKLEIPKDKKTTRLTLLLDYADIEAPREFRQEPAYRLTQVELALLFQDHQQRGNNGLSVGALIPPPF